jgi:anti-sigma-K factor RskA
MDRRQIEELLPFYALDALTDEEREQVEAYLRAHPEAWAQVEELKKTASALPYGAKPVEPSRRTKNALMARVAVDERARNPKAGQTSLSGLRGDNIIRTFTLGIATLAIVWVMILNSQIKLLRNQISTLNDVLIAQSNELQQINAKLPQTPLPETITISLKGTDVQPRAQGQLIADPNSQSAVLVISGLAKLQPGKTYQVWLIDGGGPQSAGLLAVDNNGGAVFIVTSDLSIGSFQSLGISVEPAGGSKQPTGEIVVLSDL